MEKKNAAVSAWDQFLNSGIAICMNLLKCFMKASSIKTSRKFYGTVHAIHHFLHNIQ